MKALIKEHLIKTNYELFIGGFIDVIDGMKYKSEFFKANNIKKTKENCKYLNSVLFNELTIYNNKNKL